MTKYNRTKKYDPIVLDKLHSVHLEMLKDFIAVCDKYNLTYFVVYGTAIGAVRHQGFIPWDDDVDVAMLREDYDKFFEVFTQELKEKYNLLTPEIDERYACTVTHLQRKGTIFISEVSKDLKCEQGIFIDIFPFDYVGRGEKREFLQGKMANVFGKLIFLSGSGSPVITIEGMIGRFLSVLCKVIHHTLKILHISPKKIYHIYKRIATFYNRSEKRSEYVTSFEYVGCIKDKIKKKDIFPLKKVIFENLEVNIPNNNHEFLTKIYGDYMKLPDEKDRVNHMPLVIQFEGEERICQQNG